MTADDSNEPKDLLSRRLSSQPDGDEPTAAQFAEDGAATDAVPDGNDATASDAGASASELEDTQVFDPLADESASGKPALFSDEEWALINGEAPPADADRQTTGRGPAADTGSKAPGEEETRKLTRAERRAARRSSARGRDHAEAARTDSSGSGADIPPGGRRNALDVIGAVWVAASIPFIVIALAVRAVASGTFLKWTYFWRPGFPADEYGFTAEDRLHYGSYTVDYLYNLDSSRYLADVVTQEGVPVFTSDELAHMSDVKSLVGLLTLVAIVGAIGTICFGLYKCRAAGRGMRGCLRAGAVATVVLMVALGVLAATGWDRFFTGFHEVFFEAGTWTFYLDDSLIRLFPPQFWVDAGIGAAVVALALCAFAFGISFVGGGGRRVTDTHR